MLADVFENFRNICLKIYRLDPTKFLSASGLPWQVALKKDKVKLDFLTDINILLMVEKSITGGIYHSIYRCAKANNKYMKDKNKESSYLKYLDIINLYGWVMSQVNNLCGWAILQKLPVNNFECIEDTSQFNEDLRKKLYWRKLWRIFLCSWW